MPKLDFRCLTVVGTEKLTTNMQRLILGGEALRGFPKGQESGYIKLVFPLPGEQALPDPAVAGVPGLMRTYTVRAFDAAALELTVDFVLHGEGKQAGPASHWAKTARPGDQITIAGPGPTKLVNMDADWFLLAGDMTALPAISCNLERLPASAKGYVVIEINSEADRQALKKPENMEIVWVVNIHPDRGNSVLADSVKSLEWLAGKPSIWAACEFGNMRLLRAYFKKEKEVARDELYVSSYWKIGQTEDEHKIAKRMDAQASQ